MNIIEQPAQWIILFSLEIGKFNLSMFTFLLLDCSCVKGLIRDGSKRTMGLWSRESMNDGIQLDRFFREF